jgi:hypothetical protein
MSMFSMAGGVLVCDERDQKQWQGDLAKIKN